MYVCVCNAVTERQVAEAVDAGARSLQDLSMRLGVATGCGKCARVAREIIDARSGPQRMVRDAERSS